MSEILKKRQEILSEIRKRSRNEIRGAIRQTILKKLKSTECPLISDVFADFVDCTHWSLSQQQQNLTSAIESANISELDDEQHYYFITDLYYLIHENIITLPYGVTFKKNASPYTATLVAMATNEVEEEELAYWVQYMDQESKQLMFLSISSQEETHFKWVINDQLYGFLLQHIKWMESAAITFKDLLMFSQEISKKQIDQSLVYIEQGLKKQIEKGQSKLKRILTEIWITLIKIYAKLQLHKVLVKQMISLLKKVIHNDISILLGNVIMQDLNELYEMIIDDYIEDDHGCLNMLLLYLKKKEACNKELIGEDQNLFRNYLYRLCYNNWRAKQLFNRSFYYPLQFYELLEKIQVGHKENPFYTKLQTIKK